MMHFTQYESPLGRLLLAASEEGLSGIYFEEHRHFKGSAGWQPAINLAPLQEAARQLDEYFAGKRIAFNLPLDMQGTEFQRKVWHALMEIPFGQTISYAEQAKRIGKPGAVRAVGAAIGRNPISIVIPCHRVIGTSGRLTGYAGGIERKSALLALEGVQSD